MITRAVIVWLIIIVAEFLHGIARALFLAPYVGELRTRQIGVFIGSLIILAIAIASVRWIGAVTKGQLLGVGVLWLILTLSFEILFGKFVMNHSWQRLLSDYNPAEGGLLAIGMLLLMLSPLIAARVRRLELQ